jgi:hypothetical protein
VTTPAASSVRTGQKRRWAASIGAATVIGALVVGVFSGPIGVVPGAGSAVGVRPQPTVQIARPSKSDLELKEEAFIRDLRPLFLPTALNAVPPEPRMAEGRTPIELEATRAVGSELEFNLLRELPPTATVAEIPAEKASARDWVSSDMPGPLLAGIDRRESPVRAMAARGGFLEVRAAGTGDAVLAEPIPAEARPPGGKSWQPMELLATVEAAGLLAPLVVVEGSRVDEVDGHFRNYLAKVYRLGDRLPPGFYRIVVGP